MLLPIELIGMTGNKRTAEWKQCHKKSYIKWKIKFPNITHPSEKSIRIWKRHIEWLASQIIQTIFDFQAYAIFQYTISNNLKEIKETINDQIILCKKDEHHRLDSKYDRSCIDQSEEENFNNAIVEFKISGQAITHEVTHSSQ